MIDTENIYICECGEAWLDGTLPPARCERNHGDPTSVEYMPVNSFDWDFLLGWAEEGLTVSCAPQSQWDIFNQIEAILGMKLKND